MNNPIIRSFGAIIVSVLAALALVAVIEMLTLNFHPFPAGVDTSEQTVINDHVAKFPHWVLAIAAIGWLLTAFVSSWIATRLGANRHPNHGYGVGAFLFLAAAFNLLSLPYPLWFKIVNLLGIPIAIYLGVMFAKKPSSNLKLK